MPSLDMWDTMVNKIGVYSLAGFPPGVYSLTGFNRQ